MTNEKIYNMPFAKLYPMLIAKAEKKGRTRAEVDEVTCWLTGYSRENLNEFLECDITYGNFFLQAPELNPKRKLIKGVVCGVRVENITEPLMQEIRYLDKLVDELAKGKAMEKILRMKEIIVYEMSFDGIISHQTDLACVSFQKKYWNEYMQIYNECFYEMRKDLEIEPNNFYSDYSQMKDKANDTFLYLQDGVIIGAVSCYGNEVDELIVNKAFQRQGFGQKLLLWGMNHIKEQGYDKIILHVAEWNQNAIDLYVKTGFRVGKKEKVR